MNIGKEVAALRRMTVRELRSRYAEVFGEETRTGNKPWPQLSPAAAGSPPTDAPPVPRSPIARDRHAGERVGTCSSTRAFPMGSNPWNGIQC